MLRMAGCQQVFTPDNYYYQRCGDKNQLKKAQESESPVRNFNCLYNSQEIGQWGWIKGDRKKDERKKKKKKWDGTNVSKVKSMSVSLSLLVPEVTKFTFPNRAKYTAHLQTS